ncbi:hypothetical protein LXL04_023609 [Taraxacum kok-saghyz]
MLFKWKFTGDVVTRLITEPRRLVPDVSVDHGIFTLLAVPIDRMSMAVAECFSVLKPGGLDFFKDHGLYDMTMLRFEADQRVGFREYKRSDGTRSYFFSLDSTRVTPGNFSSFTIHKPAVLLFISQQYCSSQLFNGRNIIKSQ